MRFTMSMITDHETLIEKYNVAYKAGKISREDRDTNVGMCQHVIDMRKEELQNAES